MTVQGAPRAATPIMAEPPFVIRRPPGGRAGPLVFASPHSGRLYPPELMAASVLNAAEIRRSEDAFVDQLIADGCTHGAAVIKAVYARAYVDVNREPYELDASMFEDELPDFARSRTARVVAGLGSIARIVAEGREIYGRKLTFAEARQRIEQMHAPYHVALSSLLDEAKAAFGAAVLIDWHSMPAAAARTMEQSGGDKSAGVCDMVLGDRFGAACAPVLIERVERALEAMGYKVARNAPYAGGYTTQCYGVPERGVHALQIEINRGLYLNEATLERHSGFKRLKSDLGRLFAVLAQEAQALMAQ